MATQDQEWKEWVDHNLSQGCQANDIYKILRENGFDTHSIKQLMENFYPEKTDSETDASNIDYLALSQTLETYGKHHNLQRVDTDLLQLYTLDDFLTEEECDRLVELAETSLRPSEVTHSNGDDAFRTSETCDLSSRQDTFIQYIDEKIARTLGIRLPYSEPNQAQRYDIGQEFKAHHDYFAPNMDIYEEFTGEMGQRTWTFMINLNETPKGGGTHFIHPDLVFYPKKGRAVIWNNLYPDGTPNRNTLHHGMPVEEGKKVIITKWFREKGRGEMFYTDND